MAMLFLLAIYWLLGCQHGQAAAHDDAAGTSTTVHLEPFVVNLADKDGHSYLRLGIDLAVENQALKAKNEKLLGTVPVMRDSVISLLSTLKSDDLMTPDGKRKLKESLLKALNDRLPELKAQEIYFTDFMVQR
jgi:flagellar basal body-associated protein FliL